MARVWDKVVADEALAKTIFYPDDRVRLSPAVPTVAFLIAVDLFDNPIGSCTGTFIGPQVVLTAAHCMYHPEFGGWPHGIMVVPGVDGATAPFGLYRADWTIVPQGWGQTLAPEWDWGIVTLQQRAGDIVGWEMLGSLTTASLVRSDFQPVTIGYPGDKPFATQWATIDNSFQGVTNDFLFNRLDSYLGQSGSGVFRSSDGLLVGIQTSGNNSTNVAVRINSQRISGLLDWCFDRGCSFAYWIESEAPSPPAGPAFSRTWARTDKPVADQWVSRTWMWGPQSLTAEMPESYVEGPNGQRTVIYYDKSRMEVTDPYAPTDTPWYVTNGLLVSELVLGILQTGDAQYDPRSPAMINVAGDPDDPTGPTYATFLNVLTAPPAAQNAPIIQRIDRFGYVGDDPSLAGYGIYAAFRVEVPGLNHQVASVFWDFMNAHGTVYDNNAFTEARLFENPFYATGYPITEPYWAVVKIGGQYRLVLMQCFQRRCLTYTPDNPPGWQVEAGNVGLHYYRWRYGADPVRP